MMNNRKQKNGFTIIEALVAISILMIAIATPITIAQKELASALLSRQQMTAAFLAQDGMEAVKNIRDYVAISSPYGSSNWLEGLDDCICTDTDDNCKTFSGGANWCNIDTTIQDLTTAIKDKDDPDANPLKKNEDAGVFVKYDLSSATSSEFSRYINIKQSSNSEEAVINVRVSWSSNFGTQNFDLRNFIYNYSENIQ